MTRVRAIDEDAFPEFVADVWAAAGWRVESDEDGYVAVRDGDRHRLRAVPGDERVTGDAVNDVAMEPEPVILVAQAGYTRRAVDVGEAHGVDLVGPDALSRLASATDVDVPATNAEK